LFCMKSVPPFFRLPIFSESTAFHKLCSKLKPWIENAVVHTKLMQLVCMQSG
jgi:hypothetical protein